MKKLLASILALVLLIAPTWADGPGPLPGIAPNGAADSTTVFGYSQASRAYRIIDPRDLGAVCNGNPANASADLAGWQAAVNKAIATNAKVGMFGGSCYIPAGQTIKIPGGTTNFSFEGGGSGTLIINFTATSSTCLVTFGDTSGLSANLFFKGVQLRGGSTNPPPSDGSCGISATRATNLHFSDMRIQLLDTGFQMSGVNTASIDHSYITSNNKGVTFTELTTPSVSDVNNVSFYNTTLYGNYTYGLLGTNTSQINFFGGSIEQNGSTAGSTSNWGLKLVNPGNQGPSAGSIRGTYFEANNGAADVWLQQDSGQSTFSIDSASFTRLNASSYTTNNILIAGSSTNQLVDINSPSLWGVGAYTPSSSRSYINRTNANASVIIRSPYCSSSLECTYPRQFTLLTPNSATAGVGIVNPGGFEIYREYTNPVDDSVHLAHTLGNGPLYLDSNSGVVTTSAEGHASLPVTASFTFDVTMHNVVAGSRGTPLTAAVVATLPQCVTAIKGRTYGLKKVDTSANNVTLTAATTNAQTSTADLIDGAATVALSAQYAQVNVQCDGAGNWWRSFY